MSITSIQTALDTQLAAVSGLPVIQLENTRYEPKTGVAWSRPTLLPAETERLSSAKDLLQGLYQVDLFYPADKGAATASAMADLVKAAFPRGSTLTSGSTTVHITKSWREPAQSLNQFYQVILLVRWESEQSKG